MQRVSGRDLTRFSEEQNSSQMDGKAVAWVGTVTRMGGTPMARTPLAGRIERLAAEVGAGYTRRDARKLAGVPPGAAAAAGAGRWAPLANAAATLPIVVVGGRLAGLTAKYRL